MSEQPRQTRLTHRTTARVRAVVLSLLVFAGLFFPPGCARRSGTSLTIGAAISLQPVLDSAVARYALVEPDVDILVSYAGSGTIRHQITFGAPIDVFLSAASDHVDSLEAGGYLLPGSRTTLATNTLVLVLSLRRPPVAELSDLRLPGVAKIAIGEPDIVPAGRYAYQTLERSGLLSEVKDRLVFTKDVQQALVYVRTGTVDAGFVYASDVRGSTPVRVIAAVPDSLHDPIVYEGAVTARSPHPEAGRRFLEYLVSQEVRPRFEALGFRPQER